MTRIARTTILVILLAALPAAASYVDDAANAYRAGQRVYIAAGTEVLVDGRTLTAKIEASSLPVFIAILPTRALSEAPADELPLAIGRALPVPVAVGVIAGKSFRANAIGNVGQVGATTIAALATTAFNGRRSGGPQA